MSRAIKVEDQVYTELDLIRDKGETFSQIIERLLQARLKMFETLNMIEGTLRYEKFKQETFLKAIQKRQEAASKSGEVDQ